MANTAKMEFHAARVLNILESINTDLGRSGAMRLVERAHQSPVPAGLSRTHSRFALRFLAEAAIPKQSPEEFAQGKAARKVAKNRANEKNKAKQARKRAAAKAARAAAGEPEPEASKFKPKIAYDRKKIGMSPDEMKALAKKDKKDKPPRGGGGDGGGGTPPPAAPGAGAQALDDDPGSKKKSKRPAWLGRPTPGPDRPEPSPIPDDDAVADRIKGKLKGVRKSRAKKVTGIEDPADVYKTPAGNRQGRKAGLNRMAKRRGEGKVGSGAMPEKTMAGDSIHDKVAALQNTLNDLTQHVEKGRKATKAAPFVAPNRRRSLAHHPEDTHDAEQHARYRASANADFQSLSDERKRRGRGRGNRDSARRIDPDTGKKVGPDKHGMAQGVTDPSDPNYAERSTRAKAAKLRRAQFTNPSSRDREHDDAKGYSKDEHPKWKGHHKDPDTGENVHSSGKKNNKKFANATTFGNSDDDAMLHTDKSKAGSRGSAGDDQFAFVGDTDRDPRQKWYRVSKEGGYASAMASLGKSYHKDQETSQRVIDKVKGTGFADSSGHQINVRPTGDLHDERPACQKDKDGNLGQAGQALQARDPKEFYRLCKGSHDGVGGTKKGRSEYKTGFGPEHDDKDKITGLHKAAESGKKDKPSRNIAQDAAARQSRRDTGSPRR
jgi:hypothetical protein